MVQERPGPLNQVMLSARSALVHCFPSYQHFKQHHSKTIYITSGCQMTCEQYIMGIIYNIHRQGRQVHQRIVKIYVIILIGICSPVLYPLHRQEKKKGEEKKIITITDIVTIIILLHYNNGTRLPVQVYLLVLFAIIKICQMVS